ncbi:hypothetical protein JY469_16180 [Serratia marcescens]|nr:hypothetical protein [Serratia marcescens]
MECTESLVTISGIVVLAAAAGIALVGLLFALAAEYAWNRAKSVYSVYYLRHTAKIIHRRSMIRTAARRAAKSQGEA